MTFKRLASFSVGYGSPRRAAFTVTDGVRAFYSHDEGALCSRPKTSGLGGVRGRGIAKEAHGRERTIRGEAQPL